MNTLGIGGPTTSAGGCANWGCFLDQACLRRWLNASRASKLVVYVDLWVERRTCSDRQGYDGVSGRIRYSILISNGCVVRYHGTCRHKIQPSGEVCFSLESNCSDDPSPRLVGNSHLHAAPTAVVADGTLSSSHPSEVRTGWSEA